MVSRWYAAPIHISDHFCRYPGRGPGQGLMHKLPSAHLLTKEEGSMAALICPCTRRSEFWAEFWWVGQEYRWVFFDDNETSETYAEQVTNCPGCGRPLDRKNLNTASAFVPQR